MRLSVSVQSKGRFLLASGSVPTASFTPACHRSGVFSAIARLLVCLAALLLLYGVIFGQSARGQSACPLYWRELSHLTNHPVARSFHAMVYDSARDRVVLFGGSNNSNVVLGDTWEFDGTQWQQRFPAHSPPARMRHAMTYDTARGVTVLFGGDLGTDPLQTQPFTNDVWEWNGNDWNQVQVSGAKPRERRDAGMAYDSVRGLHILFGGVAVEQCCNGGAQFFALVDTWEYSSSNRVWTLRSSTTNPPAQGSPIVFDAARNTTLLFGLSQTWIWRPEFGTWVQLTPPTSPGTRYNYAMTYDSDHAVVVVFGGTVYVGGTTFGTIGDTWEWNGTTWQKKDGNSGQPYFFPGSRANAAMAYHTRSKEMILFGGSGANPDTTYALEPKVAFVDWRNTGTQDGSEAQPYRTVRQAVNALQCGSIRIQAGNYVEAPLRINIPVTVQALNGAVTIK